jgi:hypothetical protein
MTDILPDRHALSQQMSTEAGEFQTTVTRGDESTPVPKMCPNGAGVSNIEAPAETKVSDVQACSLSPLTDSNR